MVAHDGKRARSGDWSFTRSDLLEKPSFFFTMVDPICTQIIGEGNPSSKPGRIEISFPYRPFVAFCS